MDNKQTCENLKLKYDEIKSFKSEFDSVYEAEIKQKKFIKSLDFPRKISNATDDLVLKISDAKIEISKESVKGKKYRLIEIKKTREGKEIRTIVGENLSYDEAMDSLPIIGPMDISSETIFEEM